MRNSFEYRYQARQILSKKWVIAALCYFIIFAVGCFVSTFFLVIPLISIMLSAIFSGSYSVMMLNLARKRQEPEIIDIFSFFTEARLFLTMCLAQVFVILWALLLVIPGIVKSYAYAMTPFILNDNPQMRYEEAIDQSVDMMRGNKMRLFCLDLSFIGWILLSMLTFGIGMFFVAPYMTTARALFYEDLISNNINQNNNESDKSESKFSFFQSKDDGSKTRGKDRSDFRHAERSDGYDKTKY